MKNIKGLAIVIIIIFITLITICIFLVKTNIVLHYRIRNIEEHVFIGDDAHWNPRASRGFISPAVDGRFVVWSSPHPSNKYLEIDDAGYCVYGVFYDPVLEMLVIAPNMGISGELDYWSDLELKDE